MRLADVSVLQSFSLMMENGNAFTIPQIWGPLLVAGEEPLHEAGLFPLPELDGTDSANNAVHVDASEPLLIAWQFFQSSLTIHTRPRKD